MIIQSIEVFSFKYDHHYRLGGHTESPNRFPGTDYYFEPQWKHAYSRITESCLVKITTDTGIVGWGEAQAPLVPEVPATLIAKLMGPAILGMDPTNTDLIYDRLYHLSHARGHTTSYTIDAIAGIDIALWDIKGKSANKALNKLLGGKVREKLALYVSGLRRPLLEERQALAKQKIAEGFKGIKIFLGGSVQETIAELTAIRSVIGENAGLAYDAICRYDCDSALAIGRVLDDLSGMWFEAPIDPEDVAGHAALAKELKTPIAIGEVLRTVREFEPWLKQKAMQVAQPDIVRCGITGGQRIISQAADKGLSISPHIGICTAIGVAATWHITSVLTNGALQEHQLDMFETANKVLNKPLTVLSGEASLPTDPGLGISVDEDFVRKNSSQIWKVDLE